MAAGPQPVVRVAFGEDPDAAAPTFVDISADVMRVDVARGGSAELERNPAGTATIVVDNWSGDYDPDNADSPYVGDLVPMVRVQVLARWASVDYPVFDGYADAWNLEYPTKGAAQAILTAVDGFAVLAGAELAPSAYAVEVGADGPNIWWRLDEPAGALIVFNSGSAGPAGDGTVVGGPELGVDGLIDRDPGPALQTTQTGVDQGVSLDLGAVGISLGTTTAFTVEFWLRREAGNVGSERYLTLVGPTGGYFAASLNATTGDSRLHWSAINDTQTVGWGVESSITLDVGVRYHVVLVHETSGAMKIYIDGVDRTTTDTDASGGTTGTPLSPVRKLELAHQTGFLQTPNVTLDEFALYTSAVTVATAGVHNSAGRTPWTGDLPGARIGRILDVVGWGTLRDLDVGESILQGADLGTSALEHIQKAAESDFGEVFMAASGEVTFIGRAALVNRAPAMTFGDDAPGGEIPVREIRFDNSNELIRNRVTVSRLDGVAQTALDAASVGRYYPHDLTLDGLYHDSDDLSRAAAEFLVSEFKDPKRRVTGLTVGPARPGTIEAASWPAVLAVDLVDAVTVVFRAPNITAPFERDCVVEGIRHRWDPAGTWVMELDVSPAYGGVGDFLELDAGPENAGLDNVRLYF